MSKHKSSCLHSTLLEHSISQPISLLVLSPRDIHKIDLTELRTQDLIALHQLLQHRLTHVESSIHKFYGQLAITEDLDDVDPIAV